uniref:ARAD1A06688p n=1 Tax=Blastobotrys adeninivorans TaxID=409370 RepID=A0A060SWN8_BLAAD
MPRLGLNWKKKSRKESTPPTSEATTASNTPGPQDAVTVVPKDYFQCSLSHLVTLVASMIQELVTLNDALPFDPESLTRFHSRSVPQISVHDYLVRIVKFCSLEKSILLTMIAFIDLLCTSYQTFNINSLTVHRFMITAAMVGSKGLCDSFCTNTHYAKVGGLSLEELNLLEVEFLSRVDYRIVPRVQLLDQYYQRMVARLEGTFEFADEPEPEREPEPEQAHHIPVLLTTAVTAPGAQAIGGIPGPSRRASASPLSTLLSPRPNSDDNTSSFVLPSELAHQEKGRRPSSLLKRQGSRESTNVLDSPKRTRKDAEMTPNSLKASDEKA